MLPHHASFPETAAELVLDLTVEGRNAGVAPLHVLCMFLSHTSTCQSMAPVDVLFTFRSHTSPHQSMAPIDVLVMLLSHTYSGQSMAPALSRCFC